MTQLRSCDLYPFGCVHDPSRDQKLTVRTVIAFHSQSNELDEMNGQKLT